MVVNWDYAMIAVYIALGVVVVSMVIDVIPRAKKKHRNWHCSNCHEVLSDTDRLYRGGRCPHCKSMSDTYQQ